MKNSTATSRTSRKVFAALIAFLSLASVFAASPAAQADEVQDWWEWTNYAKNYENRYGCDDGKICVFDHAGGMQRIIKDGRTVIDGRTISDGDSNLKHDHWQDCDRRYNWRCRMNDAIGSVTVSDKDGFVGACFYVDKNYSGRSLFVESGKTVIMASPSLFISPLHGGIHKKYNNRTSSFKWVKTANCANPQ